MRWFIYHWNVGPWRVWISLGWINPGDFLIPPTWNLGGLHCIHGQGIHKHHMIDSCRLHRCHDHDQNAWKGCSGVEFCANNEACQVVNKGLISPQISSFSCNQLLTGFVWIVPLVARYISRHIESFKCLIGCVLGCQRHRLGLILLLFGDNLNLPILKM